MQAINPFFLGVFMGTGPLLVAVAVARNVTDEFSALLWAAAAVYMLGVVGVTVAGKVPLNDRLEAVAAAAADAGTWAAYSRPWTLLNHVRSAAAAVASLIVVYSLTR